LNRFYLPEDIEVWQNDQYLVTAQKLPFGSSNLVKILLREGFEYTFLLVKEILTSLPYIH
jgi:hypothetical protein